MRRLTLVVAVLCCTAIGAAVAYKLKARFDENKHCCLVPTARNISLSLREALQITRYQSEIGQDKWVAETMFPDITNGFFLDVGSGDGYMKWNRQALEARGWERHLYRSVPQEHGWAHLPHDQGRRVERIRQESVVSHCRRLRRHCRHARRGERHGD